MNSRNVWIRGWLGFLVLVLAMTVTAQVQTKSSTTSGTPAVETSVERGEVVSVSGNDVVVKMEDGSLRHFANVPESARISVDGKELGVHDLKPGMKLEKTITTTTTPKTITTVQNVTGKVFSVNPPVSVILTLEDGTNQQFKIPKGQKFTVNGQEVDAFHLKKGMTVTATKVVEASATELQSEAKVSGTMPPPPQPPPADVPIIIAVVQPAAPPAAAPTETAANAKRLPNSASPLPLIGLLGMLLVASALGLRAVRTIKHTR